MINPTYHDNLIIIPDIDIIESINCYDFGVRQIIEANITWLLKQTAKLLLVQHDDLHRKHTGSAPINIPQVIWVEML